MSVRVSGRTAPSRVAPQEIYPVPAEMQGQVFYFYFQVYTIKIILGGNYEKTDKAMANYSITPQTNNN